MTCTPNCTGKCSLAGGHPHWRDACGVFGVWAPGVDVARLTYFGLYALQHRGQESAGIFRRRTATEGGTSVTCELHKGMGLVADVFQRLGKDWWKAPHDMAIGHVRYSTAGDSSVANAQPFAVNFDNWYLALAHNGTLSNADLLRARLQASGALFQATTDTELILHLAARNHEQGTPPWEALRNALINCEGAYSLIALCEDGMAVARDPYGFRPLCVGKLGQSVLFASESCAFDLVGAEYVREVEPGEFILVQSDGKLQSTKFSFAPRQAHCIFELVYFARPDSLVFGEPVSAVRKRFGAQLARETPAAVDVVMPVPDGGLYAALGYAEEAKVPFDMGIMRNHYVGRTFIQPDPEDRRTAVKIKLNPIRHAIKGRRILLVDDSIVRGNTSRERIRLLRECGAKEVHMRISCPPHVGACYYGIDFPDPQALIANNLSLPEIAKLINVDSLAYLSLDGMLNSVIVNRPADYCTACFTRNYPVPPKFRTDGPQSRRAGGG